jgi:chromosome partitioning protein
MVAANHVIIPIQSSYFALEGTDDLLETVEKIRSRPNPDLNLLGVVVTLFDRRTTISRDVEAHIRNVFGKKAFKTVISKSVRLEESPAHRKSIFDHAPKSSGAIEYQSLSKEVLKRAEDTQKVQRRGA